MDFVPRRDACFHVTVTNKKKSSKQKIMCQLNISFKVHVFTSHWSQSIEQVEMQQLQTPLKKTNIQLGSEFLESHQEWTQFHLCGNPLPAVLITTQRLCLPGRASLHSLHSQSTTKSRNTKLAEKKKILNFNKWVIFFHLRENTLKFAINCNPHGRYWQSKTSPRQPMAHKSPTMIRTWGPRASLMKLQTYPSTLDRRPMLRPLHENPRKTENKKLRRKTLT